MNMPASMNLEEDVNGVVTGAICVMVGTLGLSLELVSSVMVTCKFHTHIRQ